MAPIYRGQTPKGFSGQKNLNIHKVRFDDQIESFAANIEAGRKESIRLAIKHLTLRTTYPVITLPESIIFDWLEARKHPFIYQATTAVQSTPDFLIIQTGVAVLVNGIYFHTIAGARREDRREVQALPGSLSEGIRINAAVRLWEPDVLSASRNLFFEKMVQGTEIRSVHNRGERG